MTGMKQIFTFWPRIIDRLISDETKHRFVPIMPLPHDAARIKLSRVKFLSLRTGY